jgi:hypothetical protein
VHDLVDFVSDEAEIAGAAAAKFIKGELKNEISLPISTDGKIRYTGPQVINSKQNVDVYFRVSDVYKNVKIIVKDGETLLLSKKKQKVAPGEMEKITLKSEMLENAKELNFSLEVM